MENGIKVDFDSLNLNELRREHGNRWNIFT